MSPHRYPFIFISFCCSIAAMVACQSAGKKEHKQDSTSTKQVLVRKPSSSYTDTLTIRSAAVVFYAPDTLQLEKIKSVTSEPDFNGSMHDYYFQLRNAHIFLKAHWPKLKVIEARNVRY